MNVRLTLRALLCLMISCSPSKNTNNNSVDEAKSSTDVNTEAAEPDQQKISLDLSPAKPFPIENFSSSHFSLGSNCERCHNGMRDDQGRDVSIQTAISSSLMANSSIDPFWRAKLRSEIARNPQLEGIINDKCTRCHAPMANVEAHKVNYPISAFAGGVLSKEHALYDLARAGVGCTLCHQIKPSDKLGTVSGISGKFEIESFDNILDRKIYGPFDNVFAQPMRNNVSYSIQYSEQIKESKVCATCHDLKTPFVDAKGNIVSTTPESEFPEQMVYAEWEASSFRNEKTCQDCHMTRTNAPIAFRPPGLESREGFAQHIFVGANKMMLDLLQRNKEELDAKTENISFTIAETDKMLSSAAEIFVQNPRLDEDKLTFDIRIVNQSGHKLPSGYPSRRVFVNVQVLDPTGKIVFESGKSEADGSIVGADSDADKRQFEVHYDEITTEDQVQIYEASMKTFEGNVTYTLLRAAQYGKDNRLLPKGFDKLNAKNDIKVVGAAFVDPDFIGGEDTINYKVSGVSSLSGYSIRARLRYQAISYAFAEDLFSDKTEQSILFQKMYEPSDFKIVDLTTTELSL